MTYEALILHWIRIYITLGNLSKAKKLLGILDVKLSYESQKYYLKAKILFEERNYKQCKELLLMALATTETDIDAMNLLARLHFIDSKLIDLSKAETYLTNAR